MNKTIIEAPDYLDGAKVIKWAWSGSNPFGFVDSEDDKEREEIYGLAICKYENEEGADNTEMVYRFGCNKSWETVQDGVYDSVENAIFYLPEQYKNEKAEWHTK
jgi:hypothetical protein